MTDVADVNVGIIRFPGTNCDRDIEYAVNLVGANSHYIYWNETDLSQMDVVIIPGGFSYGDYLRAGSIAGITPIIDAIKDFAKKENPVLGICNGAQILGEIDLVPGVFIENENAKFICKSKKLKVNTTRTPFTKLYKKNEVIDLPIAHKEGRYYTDNLETLYDNNQIVLTFEDGNPNGSLDNITGVCNVDGNVVAVMPHPERAVEKLLRSEDGLKFFKSFLD
ncbi:MULTISPECIES: phosphoribosylformylglycinamidine synthase subunit PurQ [Methanosphaera]|uniref:Phosphoribosylformylglycinamidine synthase subunit PurQ n=2 Tax=Methanosphaera stadtmanae TaxID=2317 RepID=PURQ_METST|nr:MULTISPECIES: phosphoribosylformylglycinamidine synthase subunit PurQ [Methanosphaera]Q2NF29.1 RecName: Full=Phosphoribosylformylglycinamidine synthase subunit PurQ; Short=FGAM synthase; AltName: Full=Formylglycinamide ribonucleotide amidotransferase subunit I; Short=FGAR amidotransferase I; Short=FGAR-AT I; AltName: Full=Glutaminase PurQ; AltName: Full=Phosphoribosylformylglycinamidine synthase subunit I [Methanosphaera stadtmanae DSM 3091]ABC57574.1 PurQ [Methanosphaera stadtmanae DSM 3091]